MKCLTATVRVAGSSVTSSSTYRRLPAIGSSTPPPTRRRHIFNVAGTTGFDDKSAKPPVINVARAFASACAAFFLAEGDHEEFKIIFADFLRTINTARSYSFKFTSKYKRNVVENEDEDTTDDMAGMKMPSKRSIRMLKIALMGSNDEDEEFIRNLERSTLRPITAEVEQKKSKTKGWTA